MAQNYAQSFLDGYNTMDKIAQRSEDRKNAKEDRKYKKTLQDYQLKDLEYKKGRRDVDDKHTDWTREKTQDEYNRKLQGTEAKQNVNAFLTGLKSQDDELSFNLFKQSLPNQELIKQGMDGVINNQPNNETNELGKFVSNMSIASNDKRLSDGLTGNSPQMITVNQAEQQLGRKLNENELSNFENGVGFIATFNNNKGEVVPATVNKSSDDDDKIVIQKPSNIMNGVQSLYALNNLTIDEWKQMSGEDKKKMAYILKADAISKGATFSSEKESNNWEIKADPVNGGFIQQNKQTGEVRVAEPTNQNTDNEVSEQVEQQTPQDIFTQSISDFQTQIDKVDSSDKSSEFKEKKIKQLQQQKIGKSINELEKIAKQDPQQADIYLQELQDSIITDWTDKYSDGDFEAFATPKQLTRIKKLKQSLKDKLSNETIDATPQELNLLKQYKEKYPDKSDSEILNAMRNNNG
jgi:hypothetical protein